MPEVTLESLAARVAALEARFGLPTPPGVIPPSRPWQSVVGISEETEFSRQMAAEMKAQKEAEWLAAQTETEE